jgi:hypothetical protein
VSSISLVSAIVFACMVTHSEGDETDTSYVKLLPSSGNQISNASSSSAPAYLRSPAPELGGLKLRKYEISRDFRRFMHRFFMFAFKDEQFTKCGPRVHLQKALLMDFIARNTAIRVPRVLNAFSIRGTVHIIQEHIDGPILEDVWHRLSPEERHSSIL